MHRRLTVLLVLNGILLILLSLRTKDQQTDPAIHPFPPLKDVQHITVNRANHEQVTLLRQGTTWVVNDGRIPTNPRVITSLNALLETSVNVDQTMSLKPGQQSKYGIGPHSIKLEFYLKDGSRHGFTIGRVITPSHTLIHPAETKVIYRVRANLGDVFDRTKLSWVKKKLFDETAHAVSYISAKREGETIWSLARKNAQHKWSATRPEDLEVGQVKAQAIANTVATIEAIEFVTTQPKLNVHSIIELQTFSQRMLRLTIYQPMDGQQYARADEYLNDTWIPLAPLARIPSYQAAFLRPTVHELARSRFFDFESNLIRTIAIDGPNKLGFTKGNDGSWHMAKHENNTNLRHFMIDEFALRIAQLRAISSPGSGSHRAFETIRQTVTIQLSTGENWHLEIGEPYGQGAAWARVREIPTRQGIISADAIRLINAQPSDFMQ